MSLNEQTSKRYNNSMKLIIIGPMASGKSVVGRKLSKKLGLSFLIPMQKLKGLLVLAFLGSSMSKVKKHSEKENIKFSIK